MQQLILHKKFYQISKIDESEYLPIVYERLKKIELFNKLRAEGCSLHTTCAALQVPMATVYRWKKRYKQRGLAGLEDESRRPDMVRKLQWKQELVLQVFHLRKQNPLYGKAKLAVLLKRDQHTIASVSTVGRILVSLIKRKQILPARFYYAKKRVGPRIFNKHAQRWKRGMKALNPGEFFQIDHMSVCVSSEYQVKHFQGICPVTKMVVEQAYSRATSNVAQAFLEYARDHLPFPIKSIQVDGGSEFMKDFEQSCKALHIPLYVLPPKSPEYNGNVERANGSAKFEFYAFYKGPLNLFFLRKKLYLYVKKYNSYRPHQALQYLTPLQYYRSISGA